MKFDSKKHMAQALLEGRRFKNKAGTLLHYDESKPYSPFRIGEVSASAQWDSYNEDIWEEVPRPVINGAWDLCQRSAEAATTTIADALEDIMRGVAPTTNTLYEWMYHERETDDWVISKYLLDELSADVFFGDAPYRKTGRSWEVPV
jgi:hypothetical protein